MYFLQAEYINVGIMSSGDEEMCFDKVEKHKLALYGFFLICILSFCACCKTQPNYQLSTIEPYKDYVTSEDVDWDNDVVVFIGCGTSTGYDNETGERIYNETWVEELAVYYKEGKNVIERGGRRNYDKSVESLLHQLIFDENYTKKSVVKAKDYFTSDSTCYDEIEDGEVRIAIINGDWYPLVSQVRYVLYSVDDNKEPKIYWIDAFRELLDKGTINGNIVNGVTDDLVERGIVPCVSPVVIYESWEWECEGHKYDIVNACNVAFESTVKRFDIIDDHQFPGTISQSRRYRGFFDIEQYKEYGDYTDFLPGTYAVYNMTLLFVDGEPISDSIYRTDNLEYSELFKGRYLEMYEFPILVNKLTSLGYISPEFEYFEGGLGGAWCHEYYYESFQEMKSGDIIKTLGYVDLSKNNIVDLAGGLNYVIGYYDNSGEQMVAVMGDIAPDFLSFSENKVFQVY